MAFTAFLRWSRLVGRSRTVSTSSVRLIKGIDPVARAAVDNTFCRYSSFDGSSIWTMSRIYRGLVFVRGRKSSTLRTTCLMATRTFIGGRSNTYHHWSIKEYENVSLPVLVFWACANSIIFLNPAAEA